MFGTPEDEAPVTSKPPKTAIMVGRPASTPPPLVVVDGRPSTPPAQKRRGLLIAAAMAGVVVGVFLGFAALGTPSSSSALRGVKKPVVMLARAVESLTRHGAPGS
jgi:hypothetical protein